MPLDIPQEVANRRKSEQVLIPLRRLLGYCPGTLQLLVLHFQFDLMDLEFVEQRANVNLGQALNRRGLLAVAGVLPPLDEGLLRGEVSLLT